MTAAQGAALVGFADQSAAALTGAAGGDLKIDLSPAELAVTVQSSKVHDAIVAMGAKKLSEAEQRACGSTPRLVLRRIKAPQRMLTRPRASASI